MRYPSLDSYDMAGVRADEAAGYADEDRTAWEEWRDAVELDAALALQ
ncbi:hypothetical protein ACFV1L_10515 [Kitasatospora sp. NPDC059646]